MGAKRKSITSGGPAAAGSTKAARVADLHVPVDALLKEQVRRFDKWLYFV